MDENNFIKEIKALTTINSDWLRYFVIYAEFGNTSGAAEYLNISNQALSKSIAGIEAALKVDLIKRGKYFKGLTAHGALFYEKAKVIVQQMHDLDRSFKDLQGEEPSRTINLGYINLWSAGTIAGIITGFKNKYPQININLFSLTNNELEKWISLGELDLGLLCGLPEKKEINYLETGKSKYVIVSNLPGEKDFRELDYIAARSFNAPIRTWLENYNCSSTIGTDNLEMGISLCLNGAGALCVPEILVSDLLNEKKLFIVSRPPEEITATLYIIWNKNINLGGSLTELIADLKTILAKG